MDEGGEHDQRGQPQNSVPPDKDEQSLKGDSHHNKKKGPKRDK